MYITRLSIGPTNTYSRFYEVRSDDSLNKKKKEKSPQPLTALLPLAGAKAVSDSAQERVLVTRLRISSSTSRTATDQARRNIP